MDTQYAVGSFRSRYLYNPDGNRKTLELTSNKTSDLYSFSYDYDSAGNLSSVTNPFSQTTAYAYADNDWLRYQSVTANGSMVYSSDMNYDAYGRLMTLSYSRNNSQILRYQGLYNANTNPSSVIEYTIPGNRKQVDTYSPLNFSGLNFNGLTSYDYWNSDRVKSEGSNRYNGWTSAFAYDAAGNLTDHARMTGPGWAGMSHNAKNQPLGQEFTFDQNGNKTGSNQFGTVSYDWTDNATQFVSQSRFGVNQYGYSADGLPVWRQGTHVPLRYLIYDGKDPILEVDATGAARGINTFGANGLISRAVITPGTGGTQPNSGIADGDAKTDSPPAPPDLPYMGPGGTTSLGAMIPLADSQTSKQSGGSLGTQAATGGTVQHIFYLFDERGNTALRLDASGNMLSAHVTDAYGMTIDRDYSTVAGSWVEDPYAGMGAQFGYWREAYLDSYRCGLRLYDMYSARWLTRDPIGYGGGQNLYGYVAGNPVNAVDPLGLQLGVPRYISLGISSALAKAGTDPAQARLELMQLAEEFQGTITPAIQRALDNGIARIDRIESGISFISQIGQNSYAQRLAQSLSKPIANSCNKLVDDVWRGRPILNVGIGTRNLSSGYYELRASDAARVIIKQVGPRAYQIIGKFQGHARGDTANSDIIKRLTGR